MFTLKGFNHKTGEYQGHAYDNYQLFGVDEKGVWSMIKVPAKVLKDCGIYDLNSFVGNNLRILYNRFGNVDSIQMGEK